MKKSIQTQIYENYVSKHPFLSQAEKPIVMSTPEDSANKWEKAYIEFLDLQVKAGTIKRYYFNRINFWIGPTVWYKPDFFILMPDGSIEIHEVKGHEKRVGVNKFKTAAGMHPWATWRMVTLKNGNWVETRTLKQ